MLCRVQVLKPSIWLLSRVTSTVLSRSRAQLVAVQGSCLQMRLDIDSLNSGLSGEPDGPLRTRFCPFGPGETDPCISLCIFSLRLARAATAGGAQVRGHARFEWCSQCTVLGHVAMTFLAMCFESGHDLGLYLCLRLALRTVLCGL